MTVTLHAAGEQSPDQFTETVENIQSSPPNTDSDGESENTDDSEGEIKKIVYTDQLIKETFYLFRKWEYLRKGGQCC